MIAHHVDRDGQLRAGDTLDRRQVIPAGPLDVTQLMRLDRDFPNGLSPFGVAQLFERAFLHADGGTDQEIELIYELVRRLEFPAVASRLTAVFAIETVDDARVLLGRWRDEWPNAQIVELDVEADRASRHDAELLTLDGTAWNVLERARAYWRGDATASPDWELLLEPPAIVRAIVRCGH